MSETPSPEKPPRATDKTPLWLGFAVGATLYLLLPVLPPGVPGRYGFQFNTLYLSLLIFDAWIVPFVALVLTLYPPTRRFGLGLLLACGLGELILLSICGGLWGKY